MLAQLGASVEEDSRIARACAYVLDHALTPGGHFTTSGAPSGTATACRGTCVGRCPSWAAMTFDWNRRLSGWPRSVTGEGVAPVQINSRVRYYGGQVRADFCVRGE